MRSRSRVGVILYVNRSGSTLLSRLLSDAASDIFVFPELHFTIDLFVAHRRGAMSDADMLTRRGLADPRLRSLGLDTRTLQALCATHGDDVHGFMDAVATKLMGRRPKAIVVKLESYIQFIPELDVLFDRPVLIHAVRDPRAAISSMLRTPVTGKPGFNMARGSIVWAARHWSRYMSAVARLTEQRPVLEARYETLVAAPEDVLAPILDALGVIRDADPGRYVVADIDAPLHRNVHDTVDLQRTKSWRERLSPREVRTIETVAGQAMRRLGYMPATSDLAGTTLPFAIRAAHRRAMVWHAIRTGWRYARDPAKWPALIDRYRLARLPTRRTVR